MSFEVIAASGVVGIQMMVDLCRRILDGLLMPSEQTLSITYSNFQEG